jgi:hypothetical protein
MVKNHRELVEMAPEVYAMNEMDTKTAQLRYRWL